MSMFNSLITIYLNDFVTNQKFILFRTTDVRSFCIVSFLFNLFSIFPPISDAWKMFEIELKNALFPSFVFQMYSKRRIKIIRSFHGRKLFEDYSNRTRLSNWLHLSISFETIQI